MENKSLESLDLIKEKDPKMYSELARLIDYLASTYQDKYTASPFNTMSMLFHPKYGKGANTFTAIKYIGRYCTEGFSKSEQVIDLMKATHYILFEMVRKENHTHE